MKESNMELDRNVIVDDYCAIDDWWDACVDAGKVDRARSGWDQVILGEDFIIVKKREDFIIMADGCVLFEYRNNDKDLVIEFGFDFTPEQFEIIHNEVMHEIADNHEELRTELSVKDIAEQVNAPYVVERLIQKYKRDT